jgi:hypothetical protein
MQRDAEGRQREPNSLAEARNRADWPEPQQRRRIRPSAGVRVLSISCCEGEMQQRELQVTPVILSFPSGNFPKAHAVNHLLALQLGS